jgi:hypothetical protein
MPDLQGVLPNLFKLAPAAGISWFTFEVQCPLVVLRIFSAAMTMMCQLYGCGMR